MTEAQKSTNLQAAGELLHTIWPLNVWSKDGLMVRKNLAVHMDANHATSPGSGGCLVFTKIRYWQEFRDALYGLHQLGIGEIPLGVIYNK